MNVVEKILARKSGQAAVAPDDVVVTSVDLMVMHDLSANFVMKVFENEMSGASIANPDKLAKLERYCKRKKLGLFAISAVTGEGVEELKQEMARRVEQLATSN